MTELQGRVVAVSLSPGHDFSKSNQPEIRLIPGEGVDGDAHAGRKVKHRSRVLRDPSQPNLRQVHLIQSELFDEVALRGFALVPGALGENITTVGIDLLALPTGCRLIFDSGAELAVTGLREPCYQIDLFQKGLLAEVAVRQADGAVLRKAGIMAVVLSGGRITPDMGFRTLFPQGTARPLAPV